MSLSEKIESYLYGLAVDRQKGFIASLLKCLLYLLSLIYGLMISLLIAFYRLKPHPLPCKVISVGNITLGGTGKTPLVEYIARFLVAEGQKVAILTRGYKKKGTRAQGHKDAGSLEMGDEPYMLSKKVKNVPIVVDTDRIRASRKAVKDYGAGTVILDDGFQQWKIKKDLEVVVINSTNPFGNRHMLPRGILRQPLSSLAQAEVFVLTKTDLCHQLDSIKQALRGFNPGALCIESIHEPVALYDAATGTGVSFGAVRGMTAALVSGIGDPDSFEAVIRRMGVNVSLHFRFSDHHYYTPQEIDDIRRSSQNRKIDTLITTEKDAVKINGAQDRKGNIRMLVLRIELRILRDEEGLRSRLRRVYSG